MTITRTQQFHMVHLPDDTEAAVQAHRARASGGQGAPRQRVDGDIEMLVPMDDPDAPPMETAWSEELQCFVTTEAGKEVSRRRKALRAGKSSTQNMPSAMVRENSYRSGEGSKSLGQRQKLALAAEDYGGPRHCEREDDCLEIVLNGSSVLANAVSEALHSLSVAGCDTDTPRLISTELEDFIPGLLNTSEKATRGITFNGCGGGVSHAGGIGPGAFKTTNTENGVPKYLIDPQGVWIKKKPGDPSLRVFAQQRMKMMGLPLKQSFNGTKDDVLLCERTGNIVRLET